MSDSINALAVLVAAAGYMAVCALWYAPRVLGNKWLSLIGKTREELGPLWRPMILASLAALVLSYTLALLIVAMEIDSFIEGILFGFLIGTGIFAAALAPIMAYEGRPRQLYTLHAGNVVVGMMVMGAILAAWR